MSFEQELQHLINRHSKENDSNTPDFILASYMSNCLDIFNTAIQQRETWYGRDARPTFGQQSVQADKRDITVNEAALDLLQQKAGLKE